MVSPVPPTPIELTGSVDVKYVDEKGNLIHDPQSLKTERWPATHKAPTYKTLGTELELRSIVFQGKTYILDTTKIPTNGNGSYKEGKTTVVYQYTLNARNNIINSSDIINFSKHHLMGTKKFHKNLPNLGHNHNSLFISFIGLTIFGLGEFLNEIMERKL